jgi:hypothetical protein
VHRPVTSISDTKWVVTKAWLLFRSREDQKERFTSIVVEGKLKEATGGASLMIKCWDIKIHLLDTMERIDAERPF